LVTRKALFLIGWSRKFDEPIPLPPRTMRTRGKGARQGRQFINLKDAGTYITKLPKAEHEAAEWQAAWRGQYPVKSTLLPRFISSATTRFT
jgi:hypothetical protein